MKLPRWNNARLQRPQGKRVVLRALHSGQGLEVKKRFSLPVEGEVFSLTFPFIDQVFTLITCRVEDQAASAMTRVGLTLQARKARAAI